MMSIPMINQRYSEEWTQRAHLGATTIRSKYGSIIKQASDTVGVAQSIIIGFMIVENEQANPLAVSYGCSATAKANYECAYGLMQMQVASAYQTIKDQAADLLPGESSVINKYLPGIVKIGGFVGLLQNWKKQIRDSLLIPEFSIWIGTMHIAQLLAKTKKDFGQYRLDHLIVLYNRGVGNYRKEILNSGLKNADTATIVKTLTTKETKAYIVKFVGVDGAAMAALRTT